MVDWNLGVSEDLSKGLSQLDSLKANKEKALSVFNQWRDRVISKNDALFKDIKNTAYQEKLSSFVCGKSVLKGLIDGYSSFWNVLCDVVSAIPLYYKTEVFYTSVTGRQYCISKRGLVVKDSKNNSKSSDLLIDDFAYLMVEYPLILKGLSSDNKFVKLKSLLADLRRFFIDNHFLSVQNDCSIFKGNCCFVFNNSSKELFEFRKKHSGSLDSVIVFFNKGSGKKRIYACWYNLWKSVDEFKFLVGINDSLVELFKLDFSFVPVVSVSSVNDFFKKYLLFKSF